MYYRILASGGARLPDGSRFAGTADTARLIKNAGKHARYLGLVAFDRIIDERAAEPVFFHTDGDLADPVAVQERTLNVKDGIGATVPGVPLLLPSIEASEAEIPRQPY